MPNRTIYVSESDEPIFEEAKNLAGEGLSSVISKALREFINKYKQKELGMKEISVTIGSEGATREQKFNGVEISKWSGFSDNKKSWLTATIYLTQKSNWAIFIQDLWDASIITDPDNWKPEDHLEHSRNSQLLVAKNPNELKDQLPNSLFRVLEDLSQKNEKPIEYLDI